MTATWDAETIRAAVLVLVAALVVVLVCVKNRQDPS